MGENSPKVKKAIKEAFEYLDSLSQEEFEQELENTPESGLFTRIFEARECNDCKQLQVENEKLRKALQNFCKILNSFYDKYEKMNCNDCFIFDICKSNKDK